jgi:CRP-like cAMP-binding protein
METTADHLQVNTKLFVGFHRGDLEALAPAVQRLELSAGEVLCRSGEPGNSLYVISAGSIEVRSNVAGRDVVLATINPGEACGEMALVAGVRRTADLVAVEESAVLEISRDSLDAALEYYPEVAAKLWHNLAVALSQRLASTNAALAKSMEINRKFIEDDDFRRAYGGV